MSPSTRRPATPALASLFGAPSAKRFLRGVWPDGIFATNRPAKALPEVFTAGALASFEALANAYAGRLQIAGARGKDHLQFSVQTPHPSWLRRIGLTVFFGDDVCPYVPGLSEWLRALEAELGAPPGIGAIRAFASAPGGGLEAHYDQGETFLVQLSGTKQLRVSENTSYPTLQFIPGKTPADDHYPEYGHGFPDTAPPGRLVTMKPGSVLYLPRGAWHRTEAGTESFSLSICVDTPNTIDLLLPHLKTLLRQSPRWRRPLFGAWSAGRAQAEAEVQSLLTELGAVAPQIDAARVLDGPDAPVRLQPTTRFQRVPNVRLKARGEVLTVTSDDRVSKIQLSKALLPAVLWLETRKAAFQFEALAANCVGPTTQEHLATMLRSLVQLEAVKVLPFQAWAAVQPG